jgi:hypothetical protein
MMVVSLPTAAGAAAAGAAAALGAACTPLLQQQ